MIDEDKLAQSGLTPGPSLQLIYAHLLSKANLQYGVLAGKKAQKFGEPDREKLFGNDDILHFDNI